MKSILKNVTWIVLAIVLCIGMSGMISLAADKEASVDIISKNVYYGETLNLMYAVDAQNLSEGDEVKVVLSAEEVLDINELNGILAPVSNENE